jgi:hypothetical protein
MCEFPRDRTFLKKLVNNFLTLVSRNKKKDFVLNQVFLKFNDSDVLQISKECYIYMLIRAFKTKPKEFSLALIDNFLNTINEYDWDFRKELSFRNKSIFDHIIFSIIG